MGRERHSRLRDRRVGALAERQYGVVARQQLGELGWSEAAIEHWLHRGRLRKVHRGVYAVGHRALTQHGIWMAAVLASGPAVLSHRSAAQLWRLRDRGPQRPEVTAAAQRRRKSSLTCHRSNLHPDEITRHHRIPVTTVARTLFDLAGAISRDQLERAFDRAELARRLDLAEVDSLLARHPRRRGARALRAVIAGHAASPFTRSELEDRFLALIRRAGLPLPRVNALVEGLEVDFSWPDRLLAVEVDGWEYHGGAAAFERDRSRDRRLSAAGWRVVRITWRQLLREPAAVSRDLRLLHAR
jgi:very-short-patch-repair endonuclease